MELLEKTFEELCSFPTESHLCCPKVSEDDDEDYDDLESPGDISIKDKEQRVADGSRRLYVLYDFSLSLGFKNEEASALQAEFIKRSNVFLKACAACVRNWHKQRRAFLKRISEYVSSILHS